jgi:hypothetical protein
MFFGNTRVVDGYHGNNDGVQLRVGDYVAVRVDTSSSAGTMRGTPLYRSTLSAFNNIMNNPSIPLSRQSLVNNIDNNATPMQSPFRSACA